MNNPAQQRSFHFVFVLFIWTCKVNHVFIHNILRMWRNMLFILCYTYWGIDQYGFETFCMYNMTCMLFFGTTAQRNCFFFLFIFALLTMLSHIMWIFIWKYLVISFWVRIEEKKKLKRWNVCHFEQCKILVFRNSDELI